MPPSTRNPRSSRAARRADMLQRIAAATEVVADIEHPSGIPIDEVLAEAGVARSTFYVHFADKSELLTDLAEQVFAEFREAAQFWWSLTPPVARSDVREAMERLCDVYRSRRGTVAAIADEMTRDTALRDAFRRVVSEVATDMAAHLPATSDPDPEGTATWLAWMMERGMTQLVMPADAEETDRQVETLTALVWNALYAEDR